MSKYHEILMYAELGTLKSYTTMVMDGSRQYIARNYIKNDFIQGR